MGTRYFSPPRTNTPIRAHAHAGRGRIVWCLETADAYFLNGGRQTASAKDARRALFAAARAAAAAAAATASAPAAALPGTASGPASPSAGGGGSSGSAGNAGVVRELPPTKRRKTDGSDDNGKEIEVEEEVVPNILHVLDVGSCYNPFGAAARATLGLDPKLKALSAALNVLPIDIAPALQTAVYKADILSIPIIDTPTPPASPSHAVDGGAASASAGTVPAVTPATFSEDGKELVLLQRSKFDIVIFCLLLSYLPTPALRLECCKQARKALKLSGLLLIITPDSNHVGKGAKRMKNWKVAIESLGFRRCKYEKLQHAHCLAFRAVELPSTSAHGAASGGLGSSPPPDYSGFLEIPQDK